MSNPDWAEGHSFVGFCLICPVDPMLVRRVVGRLWICSCAWWDVSWPDEGLPRLVHRTEWGERLLPRE